MPFCEQRVHEACLENQEMLRQGAQSAGCTAAAVRASDIRYYREIVKSALANGVECGQALAALRELRALPSETITRTTNEIFCVVGGNYAVEISGATFEENGILELFNSNDDALAVFTDNGAASLELAPGDYYVDGANAGSWTATITG